MAGSSMILQAFKDVFHPISMEYSILPLLNLSIFTVNYRILHKKI